MARPFLLRTRWLVGHVIIVVMVVGMYMLSQWQLDRLEQRKERNRETHAAQDASPLLTFPTTDTPEYRTIRLTGTWDAAATELVRYPIRNGQPGYEVVTPFVDKASGQRIAMNRGWIPLDQGKPLSASASAPSGEFTVEGWYREAQKGGQRGVNEAGTTTMTKITVPWVQVRPGQQTGDGTLNPLPLEEPDLSEGPHWSYALQWISFCLIAIGGWGTLLYRSWKDEQLADAQAP
jgi:cytochrome oxidase assembly protein ShyY1